MRKLTLLIIVFAFIQLDVFSQVTYEVNTDDRNIVIELTNEAIISIKEMNANEAISKLLKAISIDSVYRQVYQQFYQVWLLNKSYSDTIIYVLNKGNRIFQEDDELCFYSGEIYRFNSDIDKAIIEYTKAAKYAIENGEDFYLVHYYYFNRGNCYLKKDQLETAIEDYNYALKLKPDLASALTNRGFCLFKLGKKEEACLDWKKATEQGYNPSKQYFDKYCQK